MYQTDSDSDLEEQDEEKQRKLEERENVIVKTFCPPANLRLAGELDRNLLLRRTKETLNLTNKLKTERREGHSSNESATTSDAATDTQEGISPLLPILSKRLANIKIDFEHEEESEKSDEEEKEEEKAKDYTKSGPSGIVDSSFPVMKIEPIKDLQVLKKIVGMQFIVAENVQKIDLKKYGKKSDTPQRSGIIDTKIVSAKKDPDKLKKERDENLDILQQSPKTDDTKLRAAAIKHIKEEESKKGDEKQQTIKTEAISVTKKVQLKSVEAKDDIPQSSVKPESQDLSTEKIKTKWRGRIEDKDEKSDTLQKTVKTETTNVKEPAIIYTTEKDSKRRDEKQTIEVQGKSVTTKVQPISTETKVEKINIPQTFATNERQDLRAAAKKGDEKQQVIKTESKEVTVTKKVQVKFAEVKDDIPQTFLKTESQDLSTQKIQTKWKGPKKGGEKRDSISEKVIEKMEIKNEKLSSPEETSTKKDTLKPDTILIQPQVVPLKKEEKIIIHDETPMVKKYDEKSDALQRSEETDAKKVSAEKKVEDKSKEVKGEKPSTPQKSVKTDKTELRAPAIIQTKGKDSKKGYEKQLSIKTERKENSVMKKVQPIPTEAKNKKINIPQKIIKPGSQDLRAEKNQTKWKGPKKDEKLDPTAEKVTSVIKKIELKNEKISTKKDTSKPDTKSTKSQPVPIKKEEKMIAHDVTLIKTNEVMKPQVAKTVNKPKIVEETNMTNFDLIIQPIELVLLVTSTMDSLLSCLLLEEKISRRMNEERKCRAKKEMAEKGKTKNGIKRHTFEGGGRILYSKISYADKAIQHVKYVIIYTRFSNIICFQMEEIKIK